jgi:hypothetical protein
MIDFLMHEPSLGSDELQILMKLGMSLGKALQLARSTRTTAKYWSIVKCWKWTEKWVKNASPLSTFFILISIESTTSFLLRQQNFSRFRVNIFSKHADPLASGWVIEFFDALGLQLGAVTGTFGCDVVGW